MVNWKEYIASNAAVASGKPCFKGTRISVEFILERLADGWSEAEVLENYPVLKKEHLQALFGYTYVCMKDGLLFAAEDTQIRSA